MKNVITGSLKINVAGLQSDKDGKSSVVHVRFARVLLYYYKLSEKSSLQGHELDIPYIEDASENKPFKVSFNFNINAKCLWVS